MLFREVPKNGDKLSILGYGCMRFPGRGQSINQKAAEAQLLSAIDQGVNYLDTAYPYHGGKSEPFVGKVLAKNGYRKKVKIATKLPHWSISSTEDMHKMLDHQLKRLQTDSIDYYLIHGIDGKTWKRAKRKGVFEFMDNALKSGKAQNMGFSYHGSADDFNPIIDEYDWTFCQIQYNFLDVENQAGQSGLKYAAAKDMAVIIMEPLRGGNLARTPPPEVKKIWDAADKKRTPVEWSLKWLWDQPEVTVVLSGMNDQKQIAENLKIASKATVHSLSKPERELVDKAADAFRKVMKVGCTGCQYCMPCEENVNIPACFETYNSYHTFKDKQAKLMYTFFNGGITTKVPTFASQCTACKKCVKKCPQNLNIPNYLEAVADDFEGFMTKPMIWLMKKLFRVRDD